MKLTVARTKRGAVPAAVIAALAALLLDPFSWGRIGDVAALVVGIVAVVLLTAWAVVALGADEMSEEEYRRLAERSEALAAMPSAERQASEFEELVRAAIDDLPEELAGVLAEVPIVISARGEEHRAYGYYLGDTVARDDFHDRIVIYQDTLERDFGHDPALLRAEVAQTVRHEVAHHLGWDEDGVRGLGL